ALDHRQSCSIRSPSTLGFRKFFLTGGTKTRRLGVPACRVSLIVEAREGRIKRVRYRRSRAMAPTVDGTAEEGTGRIGRDRADACKSRNAGMQEGDA
ncbi:MAG TPA: hypothetical protein VGR06_04870, partial [Actinophytocola sp.]|uniref:hypothetical protein n=1 Tax=Actinophytocola sp. TaxID=1872138 RepID=UPI002E0CCB9C|nr:hypothetical protein [Actinophytocola sp.]